MDDNTVSVRYLVSDIAAAVDFYTAHFGFVVRNNFAPAFADIERGNLRLLISGPQSSAGRAMSDGTVPAPGGKQILAVDPSGNLVEIFEPARMAG